MRHDVAVAQRKAAGRRARTASSNTPLRPSVCGQLLKAMRAGWSSGGAARIRAWSGIGTGAPSISTR
jgi:hypothetical protein